ncbi:MAG: redoxin domain-containing protein [Bacteroidetes bacterium]|nr:redoxin domain-containing protein [Bacteroidota bacterium]
MIEFNKLKDKYNEILFIYALYFILWGILVLVVPNLMQFILIKSNSTSMIFWDMVSITTLILGFALLIAAFDPYKNWLILLINLLFHLSIVFGFVIGYYQNIFSIDYLPFVLLNHVPWVIPLIIGLRATYHRNYFSDSTLMETFSTDSYPLEIFDTIKGENLLAISNKSPTLMVFLRHFGCPFCQETLLYMSEHKHLIEEKGIRLLLVYMTEPQVAAEYLEHFNLQDVDQISDPESMLYKRFKLHRGKFLQLLGIKVITRWIWLAFSKRIVFNGVDGDIYQMPGLFLLHKGKIVKQYKYHSSADTPDYNQMLDYSL